MCKVSDQVRFCTCGVSSVASLRHYWILHRYTGNRGMSIMGSMIMPFDLDPKTEKLNEKILLERVNDPSAFDLDLQPLEKDRLELSFQCARDLEGRKHYVFEFRSGAWEKVLYDPFKLQEQFKKDSFGMIRPGLDQTLPL